MKYTNCIEMSARFTAVRRQTVVPKRLNVCPKSAQRAKIHVNLMKTAKPHGCLEKKEKTPEKSDFAGFSGVNFFLHFPLSSVIIHDLINFRNHSKSGSPQGLVSSNLTASATKPAIMRFAGFSLRFLPQQDAL